MEWTWANIDWAATAAWAQAFGAIIALILALAQGNAAAVREKERDRASAISAHALVNNAAQVLVPISSNLMLHPDRPAFAAEVIRSGQLSEVYGGLAAFDSARLRNQKFVTALYVAQKSVREFRQAVDAIANPPPTPVFAMDPWPPIENLQKASSMMVEDLVLLSNAPITWREKLDAWRQRRAAMPNAEG